MRKILLITCILATTFISCNKDGNENNKENSAIEITVVGSTFPKSVGTPTQAEENTINKFAVFVFDGNRLEKSRTFTSGLTQIMNGVTAGTKKIVVLANLPSNFPTLPIGASYNEFVNATNFINLDTQTSFTSGLIMTGEATTTLNPLPASNTISIQVSRIVAKIKLGTVSLVTTDPGVFVLQKVHITKALSQSSVGIPFILAKEPYYGGVEGITVTAANVRSYLSETITLANFANRYFYVFANEDADNPTLMTLEGTYDGVTMYYPFRINDAQTGNGKYIQRNTQYTLNITIKRPGSGGPDPELPSDPATLSVSIIPVDWVVSPVQNVEW